MRDSEFRFTQTRLSPKTPEGLPRRWGVVSAAKSSMRVSVLLLWVFGTKSYIIIHTINIWMNAFGSMNIYGGIIYEFCTLRDSQPVDVRLLCIPAVWLSSQHHNITLGLIRLALSLRVPCSLLCVWGFVFRMVSHPHFNSLHSRTTLSFVLCGLT